MKDKEKIIKSIILLCLIIFYSNLIYTDEILVYVHPRIVPLVIFFIVYSIICMIFLLKRKYQNEKFLFRNYIVYFMVIIFIFIMNFKVTVNSFNDNVKMNSNFAASNKEKDASNEKNKVNSNYEPEKDELQKDKVSNNGLNEYKESNDISKTSSDKRFNDSSKLEIHNNVINITRENFVYSINEITNNVDNYIGKDITVEGFIYKDESLKQNEFVIGRYMMVCCAADMQIIGIRCECTNSISYEKDSWVRVSGKINKGTEEAIIINVNNVTVDQNPDKNYVYPY